MFDRAFVLHYTGYPERLGPIRAEIERIGLPVPVDVVYTFRNPFDKVFMSAVQHVRKIDEQPSFFNLTMGHYSILKTALALGSGRIFVMEDDCRFLKDAAAVRSGLDAAPGDFDALVLDAFVWKDSGAPENGWARCTFWRSAAAVVLSAKAMERIVSCIEASISNGCASPLRGIDTYFDSELIGGDLKVYRAVPNLAIQCATSGDNLSDVSSKYAALGIDARNYAPFK